jgi:hypothetical protein
MLGWLDVNGLTAYCSTGKRTIREWLKMGLKHARVNGTGKILVKREWIDAFLEGFAIANNISDTIEKEIMAEFNNAMSIKSDRR